MMRRADLPAGYDEENPYEDIDLTKLDPWWRRNVDEFRAHEMRPYRPPRFRDGTITPRVIKHLESELNVSVRFRVIDPQEDHNWGLWVDDERIDTVERRREEGGYSVYDLDAERFEELVRSHVEE